MLAKHFGDISQYDSTRLCDDVTRLCDDATGVCDDTTRLCNNTTRLCDDATGVCDDSARPAPLVDDLPVTYCAAGDDVNCIIVLPVRPYPRLY